MHLACFAALSAGESTGDCGAKASTALRATSAAAHSSGDAYKNGECDAQMTLQIVAMTPRALVDPFTIESYEGCPPREAAIRETGFAFCEVRHQRGFGSIECRPAP
jgi:hypothetical protein